MEVRPVGRTGLEVSLLGFGAAPLANLYRDVPESEAYETVYAALEQGVTYFDTAPAYGAGVSETRLGVALAGVPRNQFTHLDQGRTLVRAGRRARHRLQSGRRAAQPGSQPGTVEAGLPSTSSISTTPTITTGKPSKRPTRHWPSCAARA